jgi:hypothetical protein
LNVPLVVGVPETTPPAEMERPVGNWPVATDHE